MQPKLPVLQPVEAVLSLGSKTEEFVSQLYRIRMNVSGLTDELAVARASLTGEAAEGDVAVSGKVQEIFLEGA
jgi:hypothetical protein